MKVNRVRGASIAACTLCVAWGCGSRTGLLLLEGGGVDGGTEDTGSAGSSSGSSGGTAGSSSGSSSGGAAPCTPMDGLVTIASNQGQIDAIAVDATSVYWTTQYAVLKANKCGGQVTTLASSPAGVEEGAVVVDANHVYWLQGYGGGPCSVMSVPTGGGSPITLASTSSGGDLAVDATDVYWTASPEDAGVVGGIVARVPIGGGAATTLASSGSSFAGLAVGGGRIYWEAENGKTSLGYGGQVLTMPTSGGTPAVFGGQAEYDIAMNSTSLFWEATYDGWMGSAFVANEQLLSEPLAGGAPVTLASASHVTTEFGNIVADDSSVYYSAFLINTGPIGIVKIPLSGGTPTTFTSDLGMRVEGVALDDTSLYWANDQGVVMRLTPK